MQGQYWLFVGISVMVVLACHVPFYLLVGPFLVGVSLCFFDRERGERTSFNRLFQGFESFLESMIASLIYFGVSVLLVTPFTLALVLGTITASVAADQGRGSEAAILFWVLALVVVLLLLLPLTYVFFSFVFPLIAERNLPAIEAVKLSARAARANFFGLYGLWALNLLIALLASLACFFPLLLVLPLQMGSIVVAYREVFGELGSATGEGTPS
ncbi:MAG: hypothetical protein AAF682_30290 [Planctomycetota bacterium]